MVGMKMKGRQKRSKIHVTLFLKEEKQNNETELFFKTII